MMPEPKPCPTCGKPAKDDRHRPFCSARCKDVDLNRWLVEAYRVTTDEAPEPPDGYDEI